MSGGDDPRSDGLTHLDSRGRARMVDVGHKEPTVRRALATARLRTRPDVIQRIADGSMPKGDVLAVARVAGIMAAKRTSELIPLCHPLPLSRVAVDLELGHDTVEVRAEAGCTGRTGVEMEALMAASVAALAVYDMCKAVDRAMIVEAVRLERKSGGQSGDYRRDEKTDK